MAAYYNEFKPEAAAMLRQLIKDGIIADGEVDERSITEVTADDIKGFTQCHFFAGIGGWSVALRQALWKDDRPVWTGSCPCQPFSSAGKKKGDSDLRHLWPVWSRLISECKPSIIFGEQVSSAISHGWLDGVYADMETQGYACGSAVLPACSVDAPHKRDRLWFVAHSEVNNDRRNAGEVQGENEQQTSERPKGWDGSLSNAIDCFLADSRLQRSQGKKQFTDRIEQCRERGGDFFGEYEWLKCADGKQRRIPKIKSGICIVAHGLQHRAPLLHAFGNAIVPEVAARFIKTVM